jgi:hypothetical protein
MTQKEILLTVSNLLDKYQIKHCLMFGTLLGAVRDNSFISWDAEDVDLGIFNQFWKDDVLWDSLNFDLQDLGLRIRDMAYNYVCIDDGSNLHVDLYLIIKEPDNYLVKVTGVKVVFPLNYFMDLDTYSFMEKDFLIPNNVISFLEYNYGEDWNTPKQVYTPSNRIPVDNYDKITYTYIISKEK